MSFLSSENPKRSSKSLKFKGQWLRLWKNTVINKSRSGCVSAITRAINKVTEHVNLNSDAKEIQRIYEFKLQNAIQNIRKIKAKLHEVVIDKKESENIFNFSTGQEFRIFQIRKSIHGFTHQFTNVNTQKTNSGNRCRCSHADHSVHTTRSTKHHLFFNSFYSGKQNFGDNSSINVRPAPKSLNSHASSSNLLSYASSLFSNSHSSKKSSSGTMFRILS